MKKYPFKILIVKVNGSYLGRVVYQEGSPEFSIMIKNEHDKSVLVKVVCASMFEYAVDDWGGTLFLRGSDKSDDHHHFFIKRRYEKDILTFVSELNEAIAITYENHELPI
jgi:hypothetical protein